MLNEKEEVLLRILREDSRKSLSKISKETGIPISTLFELLKRLEDKCINKHVSLVNFSNIGYNVKINFALRVQNKEGLKKWLRNHKSVNTLSSLVSDYDFFVETIFKDLKEMMDFKDSLERFGIVTFDEFFVVDELKKESFCV